MFLKSFEVSGFRCFSKKIKFNLKASNYAFNDSVIKDGYVKNAIIYGKNGIGKSSLGLALFDIVCHLTDKEKEAIKQNSLPYLSLDKPTASATFKYVFDLNSKELVYEYKKKNSIELLKESLIYAGELLVEFNYTKMECNIKEGYIGNLSTNLSSDDQLSIIKYIAKNTPSTIAPEVHELVDFVERMLWFRCLTKGNAFAGFQTGSRTLDEIILNNNKLKVFETFLKENGVNYNLSPSRDLNGNPIINVDFQKTGYSVPFGSIASTGTLALRLFFAWSIHALNDISVLFIDEFDAFLHFEAAASIVASLNEKQDFQSFLTTHNTNLMRNDLTRPDACFIMTDNKITSLSNSTNRVLREGHNLEKMYVNGSFVEP